MNRLNPAAADSNSPYWSKINLATLAVALVLRLTLAWTGGQASWPDESRFLSAREALSQFSVGHTKVGVLALVGSADHPLFKVASLPAALMDWTLGISGRRSAGFLALFSVAALALVGASARAAGAGRREAWLAVFFATCANTLFYYTRHLLPYDVSLAFCMGSLALSMGPTSVLRSLGAGFLAGLGFLAYDGYWMLGGVILVAHVVLANGLREHIVRCLAAGAGLFLPIGALIGAVHALGGDLIGSFRQFSGTIVQGDFGRGHILIWQYLWSAEGWMLIVWIVGAAYALVRISQEAALGRPLVWLGAAGTLLIGLWACSDLFKVFVVYGRTARTLVPFLCLSAAWSFNDLWSRKKWGDPSLIWIAATVGAIAAVNLSRPFSLEFPQQFIARASEIIRKSDQGVFRLQNAKWFGPDDRPQQVERPEGELLLYHKHPLQYSPYLFEGFNEVQRTRIENSDIAMRFERMPATMPTGLNGYPGPLRFKIRFPRDRIGLTEPLVSAGTGLNACHAYVRYVDSDHIMFGYEDADGGTLSTESTKVDLSADHDLVIFFGSIMPTTRPDRTPIGNATWERLRRAIFIILDGHVLLAEKIRNHDFRPDEITVGVDLTNYLGSGVCFSGSILSIKPVGLDEIAARFRDEPMSEIPNTSDSGGYSGPLHFRLKLAPDRKPSIEPLMTVETDSGADSLCLVYEENGDTRIRYSRGNSVQILSDTLNIETDGLLDLNVSLGTLMPPEGSSFYSRSPDWGKLRNQVWLEANGKTVLARMDRGGSTEPNKVRLFSNLLGVPTIQTYFTGDVVSVEATDPSRVLGSIAPLGLDPNAANMPLDGYPGPILLKLQFPASPEGRSEPLIVSGNRGAGDFVFVRYLEGRGIQFGVDHWGFGGPLSGSAEPDPNLKVHDVVISTGALFPQAESFVYSSHPEWKILRNWLVVEMDGKLEIAQRGSAFRSRLDQITAGLNLIGGSTVESQFSGGIGRTELVSPNAILELIEKTQKPSP